MPSVPAVSNQTSPLPTGWVVTAKSTGDAVLVWDASTAIQHLVEAHSQSDEALRVIESQAATLLVAHSLKLPNAGTVSLRVVYPHKPELNPQYNVATLVSVERLMTLKANRDAILRTGSTWSAALEGGTIPKDLTINLTGVLPPPRS